MILKTALAAVLVLVPASLSQSQCVGGVCYTRPRLFQPRVTYQQPTHSVLKSYTGADGVTYQPQQYTTGGYYQTVRQRVGLFGRRVRTVRRWVPRRTATRYVPVQSVSKPAAPAEDTTSSASPDAACCPDHEARIKELEERLALLEAQVSLGDAASKSLPQVSWRRLPEVEWTDKRTTLAMR